MTSTPQDDPILAAFAREVAASPDATLVVGRHRSMSRADLDVMARKIEVGLPALDAGRLVMFAAPNGPAFLAGLVALRRRGLVAVLAGARAPAAEIERIASRLGASGSLTCVTAWPEGYDGWCWRSFDIVDGFSSRTDLAVVKMTSGSTGEPRGVATPAHALVADDAAISSTMRISSDDRLLAAIPMSHSYGLSSLAVPALVRGNVLVLPDDDGGPWAGLEAAIAGRATVLPTVPAFLRALTRLVAAPPWPSDLRLVISAGAPLDPDTAARFLERFGLPVHTFYGSSETGGICYDRTGDAGVRETVGKPLNGVAVDIDPVDGRVVVRGPAVASGYLPDPCDELCDGVYRSKDTAQWDHGELCLLGRADWINVKGMKVDPREVEAVIGEIPGVDEAAVVGLHEAGSEATLVRAVVACHGRPVTRETILAACRERLAPHKVPRSIVVVTALPRTERGKVDRAALVAIDGRAEPRAPATRG